MSLNLRFDYISGKKDNVLFNGMEPYIFVIKNCPTTANKSLDKLKSIEITYCLNDEQNKILDFIEKLYKDNTRKSITINRQINILEVDGHTMINGVAGSTKWIKKNETHISDIGIRFVRTPFRDIYNWNFVAAYINYHNYFNKIDNLPEFNSFKLMNTDMRMEYYESGKIHDEENEHLLYCISKNNTEEEFFSSKDNDLEVGYTVNFLVNRKNSKDSCVSGQDRSKKYHYGIVLRCNTIGSNMLTENKWNKLLDNQEDFDQELMKEARQYCKRRRLDVRGLWYDRGHREVAHCNLHVVSNLPPEYFGVLWWMWKTSIGPVWITTLYNVAQWRLYASRNHNIFCTKYHDYINLGKNINFQEGSERVDEFRYFLYNNNISSKDYKIKEEMDLEKLKCKILKYKLY